MLALLKIINYLCNVFDKKHAPKILKNIELDFVYSNRNKQLQQ